MRTSLRPALLLGALLLPLGAPPTLAQNARQATTQPTAQQVAQRFLQAANRGDARAVTALFAPNARFDSVGHIYANRDEIMNRFLIPEVLNLGGRYEVVRVTPAPNNPNVVTVRVQLPRGQPARALHLPLHGAERPDSGRGGEIRPVSPTRPRKDQIMSDDRAQEPSEDASHDEKTLSRRELMKSGALAGAVLAGGALAGGAGAQTSQNRTAPAQTLTGQVAYITGAARGIGRAIAGGVGRATG
ncbi:hypothetical protein DAETH_37940 (plasmid) [Deinococcus aetherius]|uniref:SnoaL-like domain-containing protein n=1 Tax=Deinococcus aetherius TaxID=200252 RepID=A0ABN6RKG7_9DEIO|nr:hypothetical protein [Deinococcus aetherius]BDP43825.1 hypothetical protein DAETH_37940 [Deinococcus aetherius]